MRLGCPAIYILGAPRYVYVHVNLANCITLGRILLIPVFVTFAIYYGESVSEGAAREWLRYAAMAAFGTAALSDLLDGWVARNFGQESRLGRILDPLADKLLLVSAILTLSLSSWPAPVPLWFVVVVLTREVLAVASAFIVDHLAGKVDIRPHWTGKLATALQIAAVATAMLRLPGIVGWVAAPAIVFTIASTVIYVADAGRQLKTAGVLP